MKKLSKLDKLLSPKLNELLHKFTVIAAIIIFLCHILLVFLINQNIVHGDISQAIGTNYFSTIFTPFGIILFYELVLLIYAIAKDTTRSLARQFEIISLIILFGVFKDISDLTSFDEITIDSQLLQQVVFDLLGAVLIFGLITLFYKSITDKECDLEIPKGKHGKTYTNIKKIITLLIGLIVSFFGIYTFGSWTVSFLGGEYINFFAIQKSFFENIFTILIFADILIVLTSYLLNEDYAIDFRNIGFIASTILIRLSFVSEKPMDIFLAVLAVVSAIAINLIFNYYINVRDKLNNLQKK